MLDDVKGIGPKTILALNDLNIFNTTDLLTYFPYRYNVYKPVSLSQVDENNVVLLNGIVEGPIRVFFIKKNLNKLSFKLNTDNSLINVTIFNRAFMKQNLVLGKCISVIGKYSKKSNSFMANDIKLTPILKEKVEGVYHLSSSIKRVTFNKIIDEVLKQNIYVKNYIPDYLMKKYKLIDKISAIKEMHQPTSIENLKKAKLMLTYEELFSFMLKINYMKIFKSNKSNTYLKAFNKDLVNDFISNLPFVLTADQVNAIEDIEKDFNSNKRMSRLLLGDVGSGKTIVAFLALYMNALAKYEGILMAPTEILAVQHYNNMKKLFEDKISVRLLTSSVSKKDRELILDEIKDGNVDVLIGTHSVLNEKIEFKNLGLVITDEQHRFGVNQRKNLANKGEMVDILYMSATPIPRTLALTLYGDMDISQIKTKPSNRKDVLTKVFTNKNIKTVLNEMLTEIKNGHQIYVVAPLIEDEEESTNMESVIKLYDKLNIAFNYKIPIEILHGKLSSKEKSEIMDNFKNNKIKILISTTVIEVGIDVRNATMMVVFNAERFGLATLHQLRGRIGRSELESKCFLISDYDTPRLKILEESNDGFYISEKDFELRGSGDLFGVRQSGDMEFKIANLKNDFKILMQCKDDSEEFLKNNINNLNLYLNQRELISSINFND